MASASEEDKNLFKKLTGYKERLWRQLQDCYELTNQLPQKLSQFKLRVSQIDKVRDKFSATLDNLQSLSGKHAEFFTDVIQLESNFDAMYFEILACAGKYSEAVIDPQSAVSSHMKKELSLRDITINKFDGSPERFPAFRAMYDALVHNTNYSDIEKFTMLINHLEGSALKFAQTIRFSPENYVVVYNQLIQRYTNKRIIANHYLRTIFGLKPLRNDHFEEISELCEILQTNVTALGDMKIPNLTDYIFVQFSLQLLDNKSKEEFEKKFSETEFPTFKNLIEFLRSKCSVSQLVGESMKLDRQMNNQNVDFKMNYSKNQASTGACRKKISILSQEVKANLIQGKNDYCVYCSGGDHFKLTKCSKFFLLSPRERHEFVKNNKLCYACLYPHRIADCRMKINCKFCSSTRHNSLLHDREYRNKIDREGFSEPNLQHSNSVTLSSMGMKKYDTLLATARVLIKGKLGELYPARVVLDSGSQVNFISERMANCLGKKRKQCIYELSGIGEMRGVKPRGVLDCEIISMHKSDFVYNFEAIVLSRITSNLPITNMSGDVGSQFKSLQLADPEFYISSSVDILLGIQALLDLTPTVPSIIRGNPSAYLTSLGWVILGNVSPSVVPVEQMISYISIENEPSLNEIMRAFWELEEISLPKPISPEDQFCESHYKENTRRNASGQYVVRFPFQDANKKLGSNREIALNRFNRLESRFKRDPNYYMKYAENIKDYIDQGHLIPATEKSPYIMTHHGVLKRTSDDIKIRVVFNPTERDENGVSLNDILLSGPKLHQDISVIITRFRLQPVALTCDICQMFRCIAMNPLDRKYFHIFWRFNSNEPIIELEHTRVIFGVTTSPFLANRTLKELVKDEGAKYPLAARALNEQTFVDDILTGAKSKSEALELKKQLIELLKAGGFNLGKWSSSDDDVVGNLVESLELPIGNSQSIMKVLGMFWDKTEDMFQYKVNDVNEPATKRGILSRVARTYDINGYLSPFTFLLKSLIQKLWLLKIDWDDPLPDDLQEIWLSIKSQLSLLEEIKIPRYICSTKMFSCKLVGFSDASLLGMAAVIYLRVELEDHYIVNLVASKTRVAPLKTITIPKLELGAACLLSKLMNATIEAFKSFISLTDIFCFVDSSTVLGWIKTPPYKLKTFISNRVVQIHENTPNVRWSYVPGKFNPADPASRGLTPKELINCDLWWKGPSFLFEHETQWKFEYQIPSKLPEIRIVSNISTMAKRIEDSELIKILEKFSSLTKVKRIFAYILRFCRNCRKRNGCLSQQKLCGPLTADECENGLLLAIRLTQSKYLSHEMASIERGVITSKKIRSLSPFISETGYLMVGGRLRQSQFPLRQKHPFLIPKESRLAILVCEHFHLISGHGGPRLVQSLVNRYFWIPNLRRLLRSRIFRCLKCYRFSAKPVQPPMGDLPSYRLDPGKCFSHTGLDYAGPFEVKFSKLRTERYQKCYVALFICMVSRGIHLEVVNSLTTEACLAALDRFISRRGLPTNVYSDQGTNFRGASREITEITKFFDQKNPEISHYLSAHNISWSHNPPYAPHMGGLWEAGVKSFKFHLKRIVGGTRLHFEQFLTIVTRIEAILNSRPFCGETSSPNEDLDPLTPGHFLVGGPLLSRVEIDMTNIPQNRLSQWQLCQQLVQSFWKRWSNEYVQSLQKRPKWTKPCVKVKEGDLVLWYSPDAPPTHWPIGKITQLIPGADGIVRVVKIRTPTGEIKRTLNKVALLPPP